MKFSALGKLGILALFLVGPSACGTYVPPVEEFNERIYGTRALEVKVKQKIFCELQQSVYVLNYNPAERGISGKTPLPQSWGVAVTISFMVIENSSLGPNLFIISPKPSQIFTSHLGAIVSSEATRTDKYTFYYTIKDLQKPNDACVLEDDQHRNGIPALDFQGNSFLLTSNLGIYDWPRTAISVRDSVHISAKSKQEVISYDVKFDIVTSGSVTPTWSLERVRTGGDNFFTAKRERTHELILTFGPVGDNVIKDGKTEPQPSQIVLFDLLASQINSGFQNSLRTSPRF